MSHEEDAGESARPAGTRLPGSGPGTGVAEFRRLALALGFGAVALGLLALLIVIFAPVLRPILWAAALATLLFPLHRRMLRLMRGRERVAATLSTALTLVIFAGPAILLALHLASQVENLWPSVRDYLGGETFERAAQWLDSSRLRFLIVRILPEAPRPGPEGLEDALREAVSGFGALVSGYLEDVGRSAPQRLLHAGVTVLIYFFFLRHGPGWLEQLERALPLDPDDASNLLDIAGRTINAVFRGVIITAALQAVLAGAGFAVAGAPAPVVLGAITFVASLIPFVGPIAVWLPVSLALLATGRTGAGVGLILWGTLVVSLVDNFLRPYLIGRETRLPILWLFLAILGGIRVFGLLGLLVGPAALALFLACFRIYSQSRRP